MTDFVMRAAELLGAVIKEQTDSIRAERDAARSELAGVAAQRDACLSRSVELAARVTELEAQLQKARFHLMTWDRVSALYPDFTISECINRVIELAKHDTALAPAVEVDGFRVGDLVTHPEWRGGDHRAIKSFFTDRNLVTFAYTCDYGGGWRTSNLTRKPIETGDMVRAISGRTGRVKYACGDGTLCVEPANMPEGGASWRPFYASPSHLVAVAP